MKMPHEGTSTPPTCAGSCRYPWNDRPGSKIIENALKIRDTGNGGNGNARNIH